MVVFKTHYSCLCVLKSFYRRWEFLYVLNVVIIGLKVLFFKLSIWCILIKRCKSIFSNLGQRSRTVTTLSQNRGKAARPSENKNITYEKKELWYRGNVFYYRFYVLKLLDTFYLQKAKCKASRLKRPNSPTPPSSKLFWTDFNRVLVQILFDTLQDSL